MKKYIFIDTNLYRSVFLNMEFRNKILSTLKKLSEGGYEILIPQQIIDEVNRNRYLDWYARKNDNKIISLNNLKDSLFTKNEFSSLNTPSLIKRIKTAIKKLEKEDFDSQKKITSLKSNNFLKELTIMSTIIPDSVDILQATQLRVIKGNPPFDKDANGKNCDRYIWESVLYFFLKNEIKKPSLLLFTVNYADWCVTKDSKYSLHPFLIDEFKQKNGGIVKFFNDLSNLPEVSLQDKKEIKAVEENVEEKQKIENVKLKIADKLRTSNSWGNSDKIFNFVMPYIEYFDSGTISDILQASVDNSNYSFGPYNQVIDASEAKNFFSKLYKRSKEINFPLEQWKKFYLSMNNDQQEHYYLLRKDIEKNGIKFDLNELKFTTMDNIPF